MLAISTVAAVIAQTQPVPFTNRTQEFVTDQKRFDQERENQDKRQPLHQDHNQTQLRQLLKANYDNDLNNQANATNRTLNKQPGEKIDPEKIVLAIGGTTVVGAFARTMYIVRRARIAAANRFAEQNQKTQVVPQNRVDAALTETN
jgi:hypothetical protein